MKNFDITLSIERGLRPSEESKKNTDYLVLCDGAFPFQGTLKTIDDESTNITKAILDLAGNQRCAFPYPLTFVFINETIVCTKDRIYELQGDDLELMMSNITEGVPWEAVDFQEWVYLTNGQVAIVKDQDSGLYRYAPELPFGTWAFNFNGQLFVGSPMAPAYGDI